MNQRRVLGLTGVLYALLMVVYAGSVASQVDPNLFSGMKWRQIGPFRGGRVVAVSGVPGDSATWYFGAVAGGVWRSTNSGNTGPPLFDDHTVALNVDLTVTRSY